MRQLHQNKFIERQSTEASQICSINVEAAYRYCQQTTKLHAKSFYLCARFLPRVKRQAIYAVYALCRHVDDAVDEAGACSEAERRAAVAKWQAELRGVYQGEMPSSPVLIAWHDMLGSYHIKEELPLELMRGVLMDTHLKRYETWDDLRLYCYRVASVVGLMSSEIFGYTDPATLRYAEALGLAMQLTNILRDVGEDARAGRIYLPQEDINRFGYTEEELLQGRITPEFHALMQFEIARARDLYREAERGIVLLDPDTRFTVLLAARLYARILSQIERNLFDVFTRRAHLSLPAKLRLAPAVWRAAKKLK